MLPTLSFDLPTDTANWYYEVKFDGFRALLYWDEDHFELLSRNGRSLTELFPEIGNFLLAKKNEFRPFFPLQVDGELVALENPYKANFSAIQTRGRMKSLHKIQAQVEARPCNYMIFDVLEIAGKSYKQLPYHERKQTLKKIFIEAGLQLDTDSHSQQLLCLVKAYSDFNPLWDKVVLYDGEGIVCKQKMSKWEEGKRTSSWIKYKNWKYTLCFITALDKKNGYFEVSVLKDREIFRIGQVLFGFKPDEKKALQQIIRQNKVDENEQTVLVQPGICLEVKYLEVYEAELREPHFHRFRFDAKPEDCTFSSFLSRQRNIPSSIGITNPEKPIWPNLSILKEDYLHYLIEASPYMLPFLKDRLLTVIRYPHGMDGEPFYQKNCPDYAPDYVQTHFSDNINYIVCNDLKTLLWLGNQLAIEFHLPFQAFYQTKPSEIVFDLDPPSKDHFGLAVKAALQIKAVLDQLHLIGFIKTSGNKGLQIYLPLPDHTYSFDDTRMFTSFIADFLVSSFPDHFTTERLKKKRGNRLYIDYVQHAEGKTIVCPYSLRGNEYAGAAAPLYWDEITEALKPEMFTMKTVQERLRNNINPFEQYFEVKKIQPFSPVLEFLSKKKG